MKKFSIALFLILFSFGCSSLFTKNRSNPVTASHEERVLPFDSSNFTILKEKQVATSKVLTTPMTTHFMAVYWQRSPDFDYDYNFLIRSSADGKQWSRWKDVFLMAEGSDQEMELYDYSQLIYTKGAKFFQFKMVRINFSEVHFGEFHFVFIDSRKSLSPLMAQKQRMRDAKKPVSVTREEWGSDEQLSWRSETPIPLHHISHLFLHHSALDTQLPHDVCDDAVRAYQLYHVKTKKWGDLGYHYLICQHGVLFEGRRGAHSFTDVVGAHAKGFNRHSLGICIVGSYVDSSLINQTEKISLVREMIEKGELRDENDLYGIGPTPSKNVQNTIIDFLSWKTRQYRINPQGRSLYPKESLNKTARLLPNILGYQDVTSTLSPGPHLYKLIPSLRAAVAEKMKN